MQHVISKENEISFKVPGKIDKAWWASLVHHKRHSFKFSAKQNNFVMYKNNFHIHQPPKHYAVLKNSALKVQASKPPQRRESTISTSEPCQKKLTVPRRYRVTTWAQNAHLNATACNVVMYIEQDADLYILDYTKNLSVAQFVSPWPTKAVWETILTLWANVYTWMT